MSEPVIRSASANDAAAIAAIYKHYVLQATATFEEEPVSPDQMQARIAAVQVSHPWLVYEQNGSILGYAYATKMHARRSYRFSVETTVYLDQASVGRGIGARLYSELLRLLRGGGYHTAIAAISLPNDRSVALHERLGFTKTGHHKEVGWKFDQWVDVGYWQLML